MADNFLDVSKLDFNSIKTSLKNSLATQDRFNSYDFEGSNISILLDLLSYNTHLFAHYLNMVGNEMFLDSSQIRESLMSHAKELNYLPRSRSSAKAIINISIDPVGNPASITVPKNYAFATTYDGVRLNFTTNKEIVISRDINGEYNAFGVEIYEGFVVEEYFTANVTNIEDYVKYNSRFFVQSENADISSLEVEVYPSSGANTFRTFKKSADLYGIKNNSEVFFVQPYRDNQYEIVFGNGVLGSALTTGNIVKVRYRDTVGTGANGARVFSKTGDISGHSNITITTTEAARYGGERESNESIKFIAPRHFVTQNRGVIESDFVTLILAEFPEIQSVVAYGGEKIKKYGKVIISLKPYGDDIVSSSLKRRIINFLSTKTLTTEPIIIDPEYFNVSVNTIVSYDPGKITITTPELQSKVKLNVINYANSTFSAFGNDLRFSKLASVIDASDPSIVSNDTTLTLIRRLYPITNVETEVNFSFDNRLQPNFETNQFTITHLEQDVIVKLVAGQNGIINVVDANGMIIKNNIGSIDYASGKIKYYLTVKGYTTSIDLKVTTATSDIIVTQSRFLSIDDNDINVTIQGARF